MCTTRLLLALLPVGLAALVSGCEYNVSTFCCSSEASCAEFPGTPITLCTGDPGRPYCDEAGDFGPRHTCVEDPGGADCETPDDCADDPDHPFCVDGTCVECEDASACTVDAPVCATDTHACEGCEDDGGCTEFPTTPRCLTTSGACVVCIEAIDCTAATSPVCDEDTNECRTCAAHSECASEACDRETGACVAEANVIYLAPGGAAGSCTLAAPCGTFAQGLAQVSGSRNVIKAAAGTYSGQVSISGVAVTIYADGAIAQPQAADPVVVDVTSGANVTIEGMTIDGITGGATGTGLTCRLSSTLRLRQSSVIRNGGGGLSISGCQYSLINNIIALNGGTTSSFGGVLVGSIAVPGMHEFSFNTVAANTGATNTTTGLECASIATPLVFSNSIIYGNTVATGTPMQVGGDSDCSWSYSDIGPQAVTGTGNINSDPMFVDAANRNFHVLGASPAKDVADPAATLAIDIDADLRPQGAARDMGADEVVP